MVQWLEPLPPHHPHPICTNHACPKPPIKAGMPFVAWLYLCDPPRLPQPPSLVPHMGGEPPHPTRGTTLTTPQEAVGGKGFFAMLCWDQSALLCCWLALLVIWVGNTPFFSFFFLSALFGLQLGGACVPSAPLAFPLLFCLYRHFPPPYSWRQRAQLVCLWLQPVFRQPPQGYACIFCDAAEGRLSVCCRAWRTGGVGRILGPGGCQPAS